MARILFVDDDPLTLQTLRKTVSIIGHEALLAGSGGEAQTTAQAQLPDLIITDMHLPDMGGLELVENLKGNPTTAHIPVIVLSASAEMDAQELSRAAGAEAFIPKPIRLQALQELISRFTGQ
jgi:CheY-like chemotaxis protein